MFIFDNIFTPGLGRVDDFSFVDCSVHLIFCSLNFIVLFQYLLKYHVMFIINIVFLIINITWLSNRQWRDVRDEIALWTDVSVTLYYYCYLLRVTISTLWRSHARKISSPFANLIGMNALFYRNLIHKRFNKLNELLRSNNKFRNYCLNYKLW